jgi:hypothetical protein
MEVEPHLAAVAAVQKERRMAASRVMPEPRAPHSDSQRQPDAP